MVSPSIEKSALLSAMLRLSWLFTLRRRLRCWCQFRMALYALFRHEQHLISDTIRSQLGDVVQCADREFGLHRDPRLCFSEYALLWAV